MVPQPFQLRRPAGAGGKEGFRATPAARMAWFWTGQSLILGRGLGIGDPCHRAFGILLLAVILWCAFHLRSLQCISAQAKMPHICGVGKSRAKNCCTSYLFPFILLFEVFQMSKVYCSFSPFPVVSLSLFLFWLLTVSLLSRSHYSSGREREWWQYITKILFLNLWEAFKLLFSICRENTSAKVEKHCSSHSCLDTRKRSFKKGNQNF